MLVKKVRKMTVLPNQRMQVNSKNRMTKLITEMVPIRGRRS